MSTGFIKKRPARLVRTTHAVLGVLAVAALAGWGGPAAGAETPLACAGCGVSAPDAGGGHAGARLPPAPMLELIKGQRCVRLATQAGREILVNACQACRIVHLERKRPGGGFPAQRTYTVPESSRVTLSFRGPGRTRILSEGPCRAAAPGETGEQTPGETREAKCIHFRQSMGGPVVLFNSCQACRAVVVERAGPAGARNRQTFAVAGGSSVPLARPGAPVQARIVTEKPCR